MKLTRLVTTAFFLGALGAGSVSAQTGSGRTPAEFPPASYMGKQYVDSKGCVFIRAGIDGNVTWVPRVTPKRSVVCGFKPTFAGQAIPQTEPVRTAAAAPVQITNPAAASTPPRVSAPAPVPVPVPRAQPTVVRQIAKRPAPVEKKVVQPPVPAAQMARVPAPQAQTACPNLSPIAQQYMRAGPLPVRCGPQAQPIIAARTAAAPAPRATTSFGAQRDIAVAPKPVQVAPNTRIVPRHVAVNRVNTANVSVPHGYKRVWEDDRLNPKRAEQTLAGHRAMSLIWTSTVPRRLINQANGADVTASVALVYPYLDYARQQRELGEVTIVQRDGQTVKRIVRNVAGIVSPEPRQARVTTVPRQTVYSSRSAPKTAAQHEQPKAEVAARGYVQVGRFTDAAAAQRQAKQVQRLGLPVRVGVANRGGQTTRLVIAGPFGGTRDIDRAITRLRSAGFNATAR